MGADSFTLREFHRLLQQEQQYPNYDNISNQTHVPHHDHPTKDDEEVPVILKILAAGWMIFMAVVCYKAEQTRMEDEARRVEQRRRRREERRIKRKFAPGRRKTAVSAAIVTKRMTDNTGAGVMDQGDSLQEDNEDMTCIICLEPFKAGQDLSFSRHLKCHHCFHTECLVPWMMKNDECPICRTCLVDDDGKDDLNDLNFEEDEELFEEGFRIVNGLVRFASMLGNDHRASSPPLDTMTSQIGTPSSGDSITTCTENLEVEMTVISTESAMLDEGEAGEEMKVGKRRKRKRDKRNYLALSVQEDSTATTESTTRTIVGNDEIV